MDFHEKLQELRKKKGLTQEEVAEALFVSRTAVSKWESGRGYPEINSLRAIAKFYSVTLDELLSGDELISLAEEDGKQKERHFLDLFFGLIDVSSSMLLFLPFFAEKTGDAIKEVSLISLTDVPLYLKLAYLFSVIAVILFGVSTLALQNCTSRLWIKYKSRVSLFLTALSTFVFIISLQPYPALFTFVFLIIKGFLITKKG